MVEETSEERRQKMSQVKIPERYSRLLCTYGDLRCSKGKYSLTSYSDYVAEALSLMCRAAVLGSNGCLILLYHEYPDEEAEGGVWKNLDVMTVGNNEKYIAELLVRVREDDIRCIMVNALKANQLNNGTEKKEFRTVEMIAQCWMNDHPERAAYVVVMGSKHSELKVSSGTNMGVNHRMGPLLDMAFAKDSDLMKAFHAAEGYFRWEKKKESERETLNRIMENSTIV